MASLSHSESRRLYSWWWDSHISPKNSKWLQENLTDMDAKVKSMIKLIEEDADSFARRAEMYYKKRPELMKLVEEFYRAYRALAERYDHATVELRQAHQTMEKAFPNQVPYAFADDSPEMPDSIRSLLDPGNLHKDAKGLKQIHKMVGPGEVRMGKGLNIRETEEKEQSSLAGLSQLLGENQNLKTQILSESDRAAKAETEVQTLKNTLAQLQAEKEAVFAQYQHYLETLSNLEKELNHAQENAGGLDERARKAETEIQILNEALVKLEAERDAGLLQYKQCMEKISSLEAMMSVAQEETRGLIERATIAETDAQSLKEELSRVKAERDIGLLQYKHCVEKISVLESKISLSEEYSRILDEKVDRADTEVKELQHTLAKLNKEKEAAALLYKQCLETIAMMEIKVSSAQEDVQKLNSEICVKAAKLKSSEEHCDHLERSNQSLRSEADHLAQKIAVKDQELSKMQEDLEKLQCLIQDEHQKFVQVEATLQTLQNLHSQSQEEQRALSSELLNRLQMLKDLELHKHDLEEELQHVKEENQSLNELNLSSTMSINNLQNEILSLKGMKQKLEEEFALQAEQNKALMDDIYNLMIEIKGLNERYQALISQVESVGLNPNYLGSAVKDLQNESLKLKEFFERGRDEREALYEKLKNMDKILEQNSFLQSSWSELNLLLGGSRDKVKELQESCQFLQGEKSTLVSEKAILLSQLQIITESMQKLFEKNTLLENSLSGASVELEGLREKSKSLEEYCELLKNEKFNLLNEKSTLVSQLGNVEQRLENLEKRFTKLEEQYAGLEKEKDTTLCQVVELQGSLNVEKQERASYMLSSETRLASLENNVCILQEGSKLGKKEFEEELDKALNSQVEIFILQKFIKELEEKNFSLLIECQRQVEASKLSDKLISELEGENLEQQVEAEFLLDEIEKLRTAIHLVFRALQVDSDDRCEGRIVQGQITLPHILDSIEGLKGSFLQNEDEKQQLLVENLVLLTLLAEMKSKGAELVSEKKALNEELNMATEQRTMLQEEKHELLEMNRQLKLEKSLAEQQKEALKAEMEVKLASLEGDCMILREENSKLLAENRCLVMNFSDLKEENQVVEEENNEILCDAVDHRVLSVVLKSFGTEKAVELKALTEDFNSLQVINRNLGEDIQILEHKVETEEAENLHLNESVAEMEREMQELRELNHQQNHQITITKDLLAKKAKEFSDIDQELVATKNLNTELHNTIQELRKEYEESKLDGENADKQIFELFEDNLNQNKEILYLLEVNENLESKVGILCKEIEEHRNREENLNSELQERSNEFELWEDEAATFYFDLQSSAVREVLLENKVHELTGVCESLEEEHATKIIEIEQMKERAGFLENEIGGLKAQLSAYVPVVASLRDNIASLEYNIQLWTTNGVRDNQEQQNCQELREDANLIIPDGVSDLLKLQSRIKAVEKVVVEERERLAIQGSGNTNPRPESASKETEELEPKGTACQEKDIQKEEEEVDDRLTDRLKAQTTKPEVSEVKIGILMKDIPLDQVSDCAFYGASRRGNDGRRDDEMLELWETSELDSRGVPMISMTRKQGSRSTDDHSVFHQFQDPSPSPELNAEEEFGFDKLEVLNSIMQRKRSGKKKKFLERLASDAQKLTSLQTAVHDLKKEMEMSKRKKRGKDVEYETVRRQLQKVEEAVEQLVEINDKLTKITEESPSSLDETSVELEEGGNVHVKRVTEQARKGSEKIGRLQFEVQNIQYVLLKLEDEKKSRGRYGFSVSKTSVLLRDFISSGRRNSVRRKKGCFCGCMKPSTNGH